MKEYLRKKALSMCEKIRFSLLSESDREKENKNMIEGMQFSPNGRLRNIVSKIGIEDYLYIRLMDKK